MPACSPGPEAAVSPLRSCVTPPTGTRRHKLGYEHLRRHDLRHTGLTWFADAGVQVHVLRKIAGHGSLTTTQRCLHPDVHKITAVGAALSAHLGALRAPRSLPSPIVVAR
jgi:hypothetical protein